MTRAIGGLIHSQELCQDERESIVMRDERKAAKVHGLRVKDYPHLPGVSRPQQTPQNVALSLGPKRRGSSRNAAKRDVAHCRVATSMRRKKSRDRNKRAKATVVALELGGKRCFLTDILLHS